MGSMVPLSLTQCSFSTLTFGPVPCVSGQSHHGSMMALLHVPVMGGRLPRLGGIESEGRGSGVTDGSEVSAGGHRDGDCCDWVLLLEGSQEGRL
ncbi:hypothetical protein EYF80_017391 [Liparis tanakae]|uniref:Uncharacterized protein n=1 Tax=Liparis tanakae TaxID=230148 RepID=A0A4Z2I521_9TELE|nr:hypothetical protein EYF80_017391 [Liparis tanakae]